VVKLRRDADTVATFGFTPLVDQVEDCRVCTEIPALPVFQILSTFLCSLGCPFLFEC